MQNEQKIFGRRGIKRTYSIKKRTRSSKKINDMESNRSKIIFEVTLSTIVGFGVQQVCNKIAGTDVKNFFRSCTVN